MQKSTSAIYRRIRTAYDVYQSQKNTFDIQILKIPFSHVYVVLSRWFFMIPYLDIRSLDEDHNKLIVLAQFKDGSKHFFRRLSWIQDHCWTLLGSRFLTSCLNLTAILFSRLLAVLPYLRIQSSETSHSQVSLFKRIELNLYDLRPSTLLNKNCSKRF